MIIRYRRQLVELTKHLNLPLIGAEIGVAEGGNAFDMLYAGLEKLYLIDNWATIKGVKGDGNYPQTWHDNNFKTAKERVERFGGKAVFLKGLSADMSRHVPDNSLGLLHLDGDHSYGGVKSDLHFWFPKVVKGGIISSHDYMSDAYGVKKAFHEFCWDKYEVILIPEDKDEDAGCYFIKQ